MSPTERRGMVALGGTYWWRLPEYSKPVAAKRSSSRPSFTKLFTASSKQPKSKAKQTANRKKRTAKSDAGGEQAEVGWTIPTVNRQRTVER